MWRGLLVSVRDAAEAAAAVAGGADIVDVKEPGRGALGAADPEVIAAIAGVVGTRRPWTMACGELATQPRGAAATGSPRGDADAAGLTAAVRLEQVLRLLPPAAVPPAAVKIGLAGTAACDWRRDLAAALAPLPPRIHRVAVAYADWRAAAAAPPEEVIAAAVELGCRVLLVDTFDKSGPGLFGCCGPGQPAAWVAAARAAGLAVALAGRITAEEMPAAWAAGPDVVALRSAVCFNGRLGGVQAALVRRLARRTASVGNTQENTA